MEPGSLINRAVRAAKLEPGLYQEVKTDSTSNWQAFLVVLMSAIVTTAIVGMTSFRSLPATSAILLLVIPVAIIIGWLIWSGLAYWFGTAIFGHGSSSTSYGGTVRAIGFASSPLILGIFRGIPFLGGLILFTISIWALVAYIIALKTSMELSTWRAIGVWVVCGMHLWILQTWCLLHDIGGWVL